MSDLQDELNEIGSTLNHWPAIVEAARRVVNAQELVDSHYQADLNNDLRRALGRGKLAPWERDIERLLNIVDAVLGITDPE